MRHDPKWATFNSAYINEKVQFDIQNAVLEEPSDAGLIRLFTHMSMTRDPRAAKNMVPDELWHILPADPEIEELERQRQTLKEGQYRINGKDNEVEIRDLSKKIRSKRAQWEKDVQRQFREYYFYNRPTWDIEKQAAGDVDEEYINPTISLHITERSRLASILCNQPADLKSDELFRLRIQATDLMTALCHKRETKRREQRRAKMQTHLQTEEGFPRSDSFPLLMLKTQCPLCIGDEGLSYEERTFPYSRPSVMYDHFDREHGKKLKGVQQLSCNHPKCKEGKLAFENLNHFKNHIATVHGVHLRPS
ncbi:FluG domain-containing protein [Hypoxylon rubiginosum]|uniref:FluG domain-containing protein n=1 Tax=Hypoxylon rubiginosum TaxID=110542 RepID=A0ACC0CK60_9PEZI|nr:FluG domain-containing protein [Hypoxylon rubiginosum]